jgi:hypothetical protein
MKLDYDAASDRQASRQRDVAVNTWVAAALAAVVTIGFFTVLWFLMQPRVDAKTAIPADILPVLQTLLGVLGTAWVSIISYYFGSSVGSKEKSQLLAENVAASNKPTGSQ